MLSGDRFLNLWEEIAFQVQIEESYCFYAYEETVKVLCEGTVEELPKEAVVPLWEKLEASYDWDYEDGEPTINIQRSGITAELIQGVYNAAVNYALPSYSEIEGDSDSRIIYGRKTFHYDEAVEEIIREIRSLPSSCMQSGDDSPYKDVWEEYATQVQGEESFCFGLYEDLVETACYKLVRALTKPNLRRFWEETDDFFDIDDDGHEPDTDEIVEAVAGETFKRVAGAAADYAFSELDEDEDEDENDEAPEVSDVPEQDSAAQESVADTYKHYIFAHFVYDQVGVYNYQTMSILPAGSDDNCQHRFHNDLVSSAQSAIESLFDDYFAVADYDCDYTISDLSYDDNLHVNRMIKQDARDCDVVQFIIHQLMKGQEIDFHHGIGTVEGLQKWVSYFNYYMETARDQGNYCRLTVGESRDFAQGIVKELMKCVDGYTRSYKGYYLHLWRTFKPLQQDITELYCKVSGDNWPSSQEELDQFLVLLERYRALVEDDENEAYVDEAYERFLDEELELDETEYPADGLDANPAGRPDGATQRLEDAKKTGTPSGETEKNKRKTKVA